MLGPDLMAEYEQVMDENDQDLYRWIVARARGEREGPQEISAVLDVIASAAFGRMSADSEHFTNLPKKILRD